MKMKALIIGIMALTLAGAASAEELTGQIVTAMKQKPVPNVRVIVTDIYGDRVVAQSTDRDGRFLFENLQPGIYRLVVYSPRTGRRVIEEEVTVEAGAPTTEVSFQVGPRKTQWGQKVRYTFM